MYASTLLLFVCMRQHYYYYWRWPGMGRKRSNIVYQYIYKVW